MDIAKTIIPLMVLLVCLNWIAASAEEPKKSTPEEAACTLEGALKVHPKFLYKYYLSGFGDGQSCALFGLEDLKELQAGSQIRVTGRLRTRFHPGGTDANPSPFPPTWIIYMDVETVKVLAAPESEAPQPPPGSSAPTSKRPKNSN